MMRRETLRSALIFLTAPVFILLFCPCVRAGGQPNSDPPRESHWNGARPRLFFTSQKVAQLQERIEQDERFRQAWLRIKERADRHLKEELVSKEYAEGGTGQHGNYGVPSGQIASMASTLGLAYRMTGNKEYAQKLKEALLHYSGLSRWAGDARHTPPWHSELNTARFCFGYAVGYDCIYDSLGEAQRASIAQSMIRLGILPTLNDWMLPGERIHALDSMGHNWWSVCVSIAGLAAMSLLGDEPQAEQWVQSARGGSNGFPEWFSFQGNVLQNKSPNFDRNGAFYESVSYADYALSESAYGGLFRLAYANVFRNAKPPQIPVLERVGQFFVHPPMADYPTTASMLSVNFGDSPPLAGAPREPGRCACSRQTRQRRARPKLTTGISAGRIRGSTIRLGWSTMISGPTSRASSNGCCTTKAVLVGWGLPHQKPFYRKKNRWGKPHPTT